MRRITICAMFSLIPGSAFAQDVQPNLYPNEFLKKTPYSTVQSDIAGCKAQATSSLNEGSTGRNAVRSGARTAAKGAALGALAGSISGKAGKGAGAGAAVGGVVGVAGAAKEGRQGSPDWRKYVEVCLEEKGYKVVGWK